MKKIDIKSMLIGFLSCLSLALFIGTTVYSGGEHDHDDDYSRKEYNDLLEHKHLYCSGDNFTMSLGINIVVEEVYDSTAIGIMEDPPPWLKLEKGDKLVIE